MTPSSPLIDTAEKVSPPGQAADVRHHQSKVTASSLRMHACMLVYRVLKEVFRLLSKLTSSSSPFCTYHTSEMQYIRQGSSRDVQATSQAWILVS